MNIIRSVQINPLDNTEWVLTVLEPFDVWGSLSLFGSELASATVQIDNGRRLLPAEQWLWAQCVLLENSIPIFTGTVTDLTIDTLIKLTIEA